MICVNIFRFIYSYSELTEKHYVSGIRIWNERNKSNLANVETKNSEPLSLASGVKDFSFITDVQQWREKIWTILLKYSVIQNFWSRRNM